MFKKLKEFKEIVNELRKTESFDEIACQLWMTGSMLILFSIMVPVMWLAMKLEGEQDEDEFFQIYLEVFVSKHLLAKKTDVSNEKDSSSYTAKIKKMI